MKEKIKATHITIIYAFVVEPTIAGAALQLPELIYMLGTCWELNMQDA